MFNKRFNIRVYGLLIKETNEILISDELRHNMKMTKFPGGGLEWGESVIECLKREFLEELNIEINVKDLFYISDFFKQSAFDENSQVISIYYFVSSPDSSNIITSIKKNFIENKESHRWIHVSQLKCDDFTFPFDKKVCELLKNNYQNG